MFSLGGSQNDFLIILFQEFKLSYHLPVEDLERQTGKHSPWLCSFATDSVAEWHRLCRNLFVCISGGKKPKLRVLTGFGFLLRPLSLVCRQLSPHPQMVSEFAFYCCDEHCDRKPLGVLSTWMYVSVRHVGKSGQGLETGTWSQELRPGRSVAFWLALYDLLSLLSYATQNHLPAWGGTMPSGLDPPLSVHYQENAPHTCLQSTWWRQLTIKIPLPR